MPLEKVKLKVERSVDGILKKPGDQVLISDHIARRWKKRGYCEDPEAKTESKSTFGQKIGLDKSEKK